MENRILRRFPKCSYYPTLIIVYIFESCYNADITTYFNIAEVIHNGKTIIIKLHFGLF
jgi:hypothetical protein